MTNDEIRAVVITGKYAVRASPRGNITIHLIAESEKDTEGSLGNKDVGRMRDDVVKRKMFSHVGEVRGHQEFFHGEVQKLDDQ